MSKVLKVRFDCHGRYAPAYGCDRPNDNSGFYVQATDYDELEAERDALKDELEEALQEISSLQQCDCIVRGAE